MAIGSLMRLQAISKVQYRSATYRMGPHRGSTAAIRRLPNEVWLVPFQSTSQAR